ncbi:sensor histidine kinase [Streptomyces sp. NPDC058676]|uniref:sensor histidine kinase n=1 Tax=unclassified Streptomyces TaxID=2593676 RepID=UPI00364892D4
MAAYVQRYAEGHSRVADAVTAVMLLAVFLAGSELTVPGSRQPGRLWPAVLLAGISCTTLLWQRSHPRIAVLVTAACVGAASGLGYLLTPLIMAPVMAALYWLALGTDRKTTRVFTLAVLIQLVTTAVIADPADHPLAYRTIAPTAWVLLPVVTGGAVRLRRAYVQAVQARAEAEQARAEYAERTREEEARHRVAEERMRIARELHDVVAHHLALANAQAGTAAHLADTSPDLTRTILADLAGTTSSALRELKATVGLLRQPNDPDTPLDPSPGLARLPDLVTAVESAGLKVTVTTEGEPRRLSPGVDLTAFRIVQEALTNVTKHADAAAVHVRLVYAQDRLNITVTDDGAGKTPASLVPGTGFGLIGMRERAHSVGGDLDAGRRPEGGFEVTTALPLYSESPEEDREA